MSAHDTSTATEAAPRKETPSGYSDDFDENTDPTSRATGTQSAASNPEPRLASGYSTSSDDDDTDPAGGRREQGDSPSQMNKIPPEEEYVQRQLLQSSRDLLNEVHITSGSWDRKLLEKYVLKPLENILEGLPPEPRRRSVADSLPSSINRGTSPTNSSGRETPIADAVRQQQHIHMTLAAAKDRRAKHEVTLDRVVKLVNVVAEHKQKTIEVLQAIVKRSAAVEKIIQLEQESNLTDVELQTNVLSACYDLRNATLKAVEAIMRWRTGLTLPHPFIFEQRNYLFTIIMDMKKVQALPRISKLSQLQFVRFPLFSNMPSLSLFSRDPANHTKPVNRGSRIGAPPPTSPQVLQRLLAAEAYVHGEVERQATVIRELAVLASKGRYAPALNISAVYPALYGKAKAQASPTMSGSVASRQPTRKLSVDDKKRLARGPLVGVEVKSAVEMEQLQHILVSSLEKLKEVPVVEGVETDASIEHELADEPEDDPEELRDEQEGDEEGSEKPSASSD